MDRRAFLKRLGFGGAGAVAVGAPVGAYFIGDHEGEKRELGAYSSSVGAGGGHGHADIWWSVDANEKVLALTFDDGPTEQFTSRVLDMLEQYDVTASFFLIGELVERRPDDVRRAIEAGHEVANHTFDHYSAAKQTSAELRRTMERGADAVAEILGERPRWFRPVKGHITGALMRTASDLGHDVAVWTYGRGPAAGEPGQIGDQDVSGIEQYMIDHVEDGAIVILHDGIGRSAFEWSGVDEQLVRQREAELQALPAVLERYLANGFRFLTISELIDGYGRTDQSATPPGST